MIPSSFLNAMHEGVMILDTSNYIVSVNATALKLFDFTHEYDLLGKSFKSIYKKCDDAACFISVLEEEGYVRNWKSTFLKSKSTTFDGLCSGSLMNESGVKNFRAIFIQEAAYIKSRQARDANDTHASSDEASLNRISEVLASNVQLVAELSGLFVNEFSESDHNKTDRLKKLEDVMSKIKRIVDLRLNARKFE